MIKNLDSAKKFVSRNQSKILIITTVAATASALIRNLSLKQHDFLKEKNL